MIVDHIAWQFFDVLIAPGTVRFWTRLSMPLFCVLMGYFLASRWSATGLAASGRASKETERPGPVLNWSRLGQIALAAAVLNVFYYTRYGQLEILASLLVSYGVFAVFTASGGQRWFGLAALAVFGFDLDPTRIAVREGRELFDFPISVVVAIVAIGAILRNHGAILAVVSSLAMLAASWIVAPPTVYVIWFVPLAVLLVVLGERFTKVQVPALEQIGRYPLTIYTAQYLLLFLLAS